VLIIPEGNIPEVEYLFQAALEAATILNDFHFILRLHPLLQSTQFEKDLIQQLEPIANMKVSGQVKIEDDFKQSSFVLYRGSSAVLYAILAGLKPYYLDSPSAPYIDPLFELKDFRETVCSGRGLAQHLRQL